MVVVKEEEGEEERETPGARALVPAPRSVRPNISALVFDSQWEHKVQDNTNETP